MVTKVSKIEESLSEIDFKSLCNKKFHASPDNWEDQVLYFLMLDRFSDGKEDNYLDNDEKLVKNGKTPLLTDKIKENALLNDASRKQWDNYGTKWNGGNLKGLTTKMGYLKRMGVTAIWLSPIFKQVSFQETYHGYGIQNFIDVDPHFGTREDLKKMVDTAHKYGIYVVMDIIMNHAGDVFSYSCGDPGYWNDISYDIAGFNDKNGKPLSSDAILGPDDAVWPVEFQKSGTFHQKGHITNWDNYPEYLDGDFCDLKDINLGWGDMENYNPSDALKAVCDSYKFWIAYADIDGFRIDTVKHMDLGSTRYFASAINEFTESIGKENFYLIGEITGGRKNAYETLEATGLNAALGIDDVQDKMEYLVKGYRNPEDYFNLFRNSLLLNKDSHIWFNDKVITMINDHDQVSKGSNKARFCADSNACKVVFNALALNLMTMGIPCIYYGTEQLFDGNGGSDKYIREAMFGGEFGAFRSHGAHCFNEDTDVYMKLQEITKIRKNKLPLRRGRQYLRKISGNGNDFGYPIMMGNEIRSVVAWSRIFNNQEILLAINTDYNNQSQAWVTIDFEINKNQNSLKCIYSTEKNMIGATIDVASKNGRSVYLTVPAAGFVIYEAV